MSHLFVQYRMLRAYARYDRLAGHRDTAAALEARATLLAERIGRGET